MKVLLRVNTITLARFRNIYPKQFKSNREVIYPWRIIVLNTVYQSEHIYGAMCFKNSMNRIYVLLRMPGLSVVDSFGSDALFPIFCLILFLVK